MMLNLAVLISGSGSNLKAILDACSADAFPARVRVVISNNKDAGGLAHATHYKIPVHVIDHRDFTTREEFDERIHTVLQSYPVDIICLAGFMRILSASFINQWAGRILNIHPSLLPAYKGLHTHKRVLENKESVSGCSVHFVTAGLDDGPIIVQKSVPVMADDTPDTLAARVLKEEHKAYPEAIRLLAEGRVCFLPDGGVEIKN
jgi:phosphoribosylglycinamide formyltransferase 1